MQNKIIVAENAGFCFGVKRATDEVEKRIATKKENERLFTLGHLIHNDGYNKWLEDNGVESIEISDIENICHTTDENSPTTVFIRAHGIPTSTEELLKKFKEKNVFFDYVDLTCPYVKKIHRIAKENSGEDTVFALLGSPVHPEVIGITSYVNGDSFVFENANELKSRLENEHLLKMHKKNAEFGSSNHSKFVGVGKKFRSCKKLLYKFEFF